MNTCPTCHPSILQLILSRGSPSSNQLFSEPSSDNADESNVKPHRETTGTICLFPALICITAPTCIISPWQEHRVKPKNPRFQLAESYNTIRASDSASLIGTTIARNTCLRWPITYFVSIQGLSPHFSCSQPAHSKSLTPHQNVSAPSFL